MTKPRTVRHALTVFLALAGAGYTQPTAPSVHLVLPERPRLLQGQLVDLVFEVRNAATISNVKVTADSTDLTSNFGKPSKAALDCGSGSAWVARARGWVPEGRFTLGRWGMAVTVVAVTPESARRVIAVVDLAERSSQLGGAPMALPFDQ